MKEAIEKLESLIESGVSAAAIARALGVSSAAISTFRKGEYKGNSHDLAKKIKLYTDNYNKKDKVCQDVFLSKDLKMALGIINIAVEEREIAVITGEAGSGKSTALKEYAKTHPNAVLLEATLHTTAKVLLEELCCVLKVNAGRSLHSKVVSIAEHLVKSDIVILFCVLVWIQKSDRVYQCLL